MRRPICVRRDSALTSKELNESLIRSFPSLLTRYNEEVEWQEGDDTGSHIVFGDVLVPYIKACIAEERRQELVAVFRYMETLLQQRDKYVDEVVAFSVLEGLIDQMKHKPEVLSLLGPEAQTLLSEL